jgi:hypothetical protein
MNASHRYALKSWFWTNTHSVGPSASSQCTIGMSAALSPLGKDVVYQGIPFHLGPGVRQPELPPGKRSQRPAATEIDLRTV